jgi:pyruvate formate lyase activating enzyme
MQIRGWIRTSLIDYPGKIATVLFTGGCNFRCPYCQNSNLVLHPDSLPEIDLAGVFQLLMRRRGLIDGVVITGGEPTLQNGIEGLLHKVKELDLATKLDTNGYRPEVLRELWERGSLDCVAMDIKTSPAKYHLAAGVPVDVERIQESVRLILTSGMKHEFRTTVVPDIVAFEDIKEIVKLIAGAEKYVLQQFRPQQTLDPRLGEIALYPAEVLLEMARMAENWVGEVEVRGI